MIEATVTRNGKVILHRLYPDPTLTLEDALRLQELYVINEQLNHAGECALRVFYPTLAR